MNRRTILLGTLGAAVGAVLPKEQTAPKVVEFIAWTVGDQWAEVCSWDGKECRQTCKRVRLQPNWSQWHVRRYVEGAIG